MPILGNVNMVSPPVTGPGSVGGVAVPVIRDVDGRRLDFAGLDGQVIEAWPSTRSVVIKSGITGLNVPPRRIATDEYPGLDGARIRAGGVSTGARTVGLPMFFQGTDDQPGSLDEVMARFKALLDYRRTDYAAAEGTFDLVATGADGVSTRRLRCLYTDGLEGNLGLQADEGTWWLTAGVNATAVNPYWRGEEWTTPVVALPQPRPFLRVSSAPSGYLALSTSTAIGADMPVTVGGDVDSPAIIDLTGPAASTVVTSPAGLSITLGSLAASDVMSIDTGSAATGRLVTVTLNGDVDAGWAKVGVNPRWLPLPPGDTTISVVLTDATSATRARVHGYCLHETAFW